MAIPILLKDKVFNYISDRPLLRDTVATTLISIVGKSAGFLIPFFIATWFGVSSETDAFFFAYGLIIFLATVFSPVVEGIIVPFVAEARANGEDVGAFVGRILGMSAVGLAALSIGFIIVIKPLLSITARFSPEGLELIFLILLESAPLIVLLVWTSILAGTLNAYMVFGVPAISPAFRAAATLSFIFMFKDKIGIHAIALGYVAGEIFRLFVLFGVLWRLNLFRIKLSLGWEEKFKQFLNTSLYQIIGMSVLAFTPTINKTMASWLGSGKVTVLEYADRLYMIPVTLLSSGFIVAILSHWSSNYRERGDEGLRKDVLKAVRRVGLAGLLLTIAIYFLKDQIALFAYGRGEFPKEKLSMVASILGFYSLGLIPYFLSQVYTRAFLIMKNTKVLMQTALVIISATLILNYALMKMKGVEGLALSSSIAQFIAFIYLNFVLFRRSDGIS